MFLVIISISIYNFGIYLILVLSICNAIQSADCHVQYFLNKLSIYLMSTVTDSSCSCMETMSDRAFVHSGFCTEAEFAAAILKVDHH